MYLNLEESHVLGIVCSDNWHSLYNLQERDDDTFRLKCDTVPYLTLPLTTNL